MEEKNPNKIEEEIDFQSIAKNPIRWFGLIYPYFFVLILIGGLYYVYNLNYITENNVKPTITDSTRLKTELASKPAVMLEGVDINVVSQPTAELISKGKDLFTANCSSCHGSGGKGDGVAGGGLNPKPRNFVDDAEWTNGKTLADMYKTLQEGVAGTGMVAYEYLPVADRIEMIHFIHSLMKDYPKNTPEELAALDQTYALSAGKITPSQIPVSLAIDIIIGENEEQENMAIALAQVTFSRNQESGYEIYKKVVKDKNELSYFLIRSDAWMASNTALKSYATPEINNNGFNPSLFKLSEEKLTLLRQFLLSIYQQKYEAKR